MNSSGLIKKYFDTNGEFNEKIFLKKFSWEDFLDLIAKILSEKEVYIFNGEDSTHLSEQPLEL